MGVGCPLKPGLPRADLAFPRKDTEKRESEKPLPTPFNAQLWRFLLLSLQGSLDSKSFLSCHLHFLFVSEVKAVEKRADQESGREVVAWGLVLLLEPEPLSPAVSSQQLGGPLIAGRPWREPVFVLYRLTCQAWAFF